MGAFLLSGGTKGMKLALIATCGGAYLMFPWFYVCYLYEVQNVEVVGFVLWALRLIGKL